MKKKEKKAEIKISPRMAILAYDLSTPEGKEDFVRATKADALCAFTWDFGQVLHEAFNHPERLDGCPKIDLDTIDYLLKRRWELLNEHGIDMDELWS